MRKLKSLEVISSKGRNSTIDIFRSLAIISVILFHFNNFLPYGQLGVDLFFVISGLLVGGILTNDFIKEKKINFFKFFLQRGFKIWPSLYVFLLVGNLIAYFLYRNIAPDQFIPFWDLKRYLLLYQNYTGLPFHWSFDHIWSLCVEEHFYILLPIAFILLQFFNGNKKMLFISVGLVIAAGIVFKVLALYFTNSKDTYSATHNRIDALGWGVLLNLFLTYYPEKFENTIKCIQIAISGVILFLIALLTNIYTDSIFYHKVVLHSIVPIAFFLMMFGTYKMDFSKLKVLRFIAYYSYNWYLWHPLFVIAITHYLGNNILGVSVYILGSFITAVFFTTLVEEPVLKRRNIIINKLFPEKVKYEEITLSNSKEESIRNKAVLNDNY